MTSWTNKEERILRTDYPGGGVERCLPQIPRHSPSAIQSHARALGLTRRRALDAIPPIERARISSLLARGKTEPDLARMFHAEPDAIHAIHTQSAAKRETDLRRAARQEMRRPTIRTQPSATPENAFQIWANVDFVTLKYFDKQARARLVEVPDLVARALTMLARADLLPAVLDDRKSKR